MSSDELGHLAAIATDELGAAGAPNPCAAAGVTPAGAAVSAAVTTVRAAATLDVADAGSEAATAADTAEPHAEE